MKTTANSAAANTAAANAAAGHPVERRDVLKSLAAAVACGTLAGRGTAVAQAAVAQEGENDFKPLFNGKDLTGWDGNPELWTVEDGAIVGRTTPEKPTKGNTFLIYRTADVADFELRLQYRIVSGNSGIQYRSKEVSKWVISGYQADIDSGEKFSGILYEEKARGVLATRGQKVTIAADGTKKAENVADAGELSKSIKKEEWNDYTISAQGNHLIHKINDVVMSEVIDDQEGKRAASGLLALQLHAGPPMTIQFKNIRIKASTAPQ